VENTGVHSFQLSDARGGLHDYVVTEHPAGDGMGIMYGLLELGAPTVLGLAGAALKSEDLLGAVLDAVGGGERDFGVSDLGRALSGLDLSTVGPELARALGTGRAPALTRQVLAHTLRDGKRLRDDAQFNMAYQANYAELLTAVWRVCTINRFFPVPSTLLGDSSGSPKKASPPETSPDVD
jgi:hypothetical protein